MLKTLDKIKELPDNSTDIESDNIIKRYQRRPRKLEELCLANFVAWFNCVKDKHSDDSSTSCNTTGPSDDFLLETDLTDYVDDDTTEYKLKGGMKLVKRKRAKIIRSVRFNKEKEPENYYREQLMLYTPWRNEQKAAKNTANKNSKKKKKDATSTIQGCKPRDCTVKGIQSSPKHNLKTVATTNVSVSGQPLAPPAPSSSTMCTEVTESADGQPPPQSSSTMCTQSAGGQPPPQSSQSAGGQPPPQSSSTMCTQSAGAQPPARPSPSKTGASLPTSPEGPHIIAYVHNLSLLKHNKRNTIDYTTLTLQTDATTTQTALCYSKTKRKLLHEHETKRAPIKISRYMKSGDKTKIVINDKTLLAKPDDMDYTFQYYNDADQPVTPLSDLLKDNASKEDNITVCAKVVKVSDPKNAVTQQSRGNKVSEVTLLVLLTLVLPVIHASSRFLVHFVYLLASHFVTDDRYHN